MNRSSMFILPVFFAILVQTTQSANQKFTACDPKHCGDGLNISYPFWIQGEHETYCGHPLYGINCIEEKPVVRISNGVYIIRNISYGEQAVLLVDTQVSGEACPTPEHNISLLNAPFQFGPNYVDLFIFYNCTSVPTDYYTYSVACAKTTDTNRHSFAVLSHEFGPQYLNASAQDCQSMVNAPVATGKEITPESLVKMSYIDILREGFLLKWPLASNCTECEKSGGHCGFEQNNFVCFCPDHTHSRTCKKELGTVLSVDESYETCLLPVNCGQGPDISYPFWVDGEQNSSCGSPGFGISCKDRQPIIMLSGDEYIIRDIVYKEQLLHIRKKRLSNGICSPLAYRVEFNQFLFSSVPNSVNLSLFFNCTALLSSEYSNYSFGCPADTPGNRNLALLSNDSKLEYVNQSGQCANHEIIHVDVFGNGMAPEDYIDGFWEAGFHLKWNAAKCDECSESGGRCGFSFTSNKFMCFCRDRPHQRSCKDENRRKTKIAIGLGAGVGSIILTCIGFIIYQRLKRKRSSSSSALISRDLSRDSSLKPDPEMGGLFFETKLFTYKELDEATNHFDSNKELGDGGFGTVYHGKLRDGRVVAVKRLFEHNYKRVEQFMNEIEILSRLRHQNLVSLYGCTSRHSRELLLVYEFVPNGTVADHLHGERVEEGLLTWPIRMSIAIQSADALAYLHASEIIHRDVKSNNILLDNNFHVKVADFGLSRLFPTDVTHVSTAPQGTPGYVDPEYYQCYQLTNKSDVYSFGVVLIELISSKPAVDIGRHRHEINLANMAVNRIHNQALHELVDPSLGYDTDYSVRNMITLVAELAFRCLQQENEMRPGMTEVLEILRGIEKEEYKKRKTDDMDTSAVARLLKTSEPLSPDTVTGKWLSKESTPNTSG